MSGKQEKDQNLIDKERQFLEEKKNQSAADQGRVPDQQHRLKDQENLRR